MENAADWDYAALRQRMLRLKAPPFKTGNAHAGQHCPWCPLNSLANCQLMCRAEYTKTYGVEPG